MTTIADLFKTKNATFFTKGADRITVDLIRSVECVKSVEVIAATSTKPGGFRVVFADSALSIFKHEDPQAFAETKQGFLGWIDRVGNKASKADTAKTLAEVQDIDGMLGVVADREFTLDDDAFLALEEISKRSESVLFVYDSVMSKNGEFLIGKLWEVGQELIRKPWWKFWA